jgi:hypothetical protein
MTAELLLIEKADGVYDAESSEDFPTYDPFIVPTQVSYAPSEVQNLEVIENSWRVVNNDYQYYVDIDWDLPLTGAADAFEIYVAIDDGPFEFVDVVKSTDYEYIVDHDNLDIEHHFKVLAVAANGDKIGLADVGEVVATPLRKVTPPSDVSALYLNVTNQVLQLEWPAIPDADIRRYMIRFSPDPDALWEQSVVLLEIDKGTVSASVQARTGKYLIKAYDINGNQSSGPAMAFTSIPELFGLNFIEETNDFPTLPGVLDKVVTNLGGISLQEAVSGVPDDVEYYPEGYYYYEQLLDLGEIYTVRLQSLVQAQGYSPFDLMINWTTLDELAAMSNSGSSDWDVRTEVRYTDDVDVMANWPSLDVIDPINVGFQELWSDWKEFIMGDFTGRIFQYRLKLISNVLSVSPLVFDGVIKADMPDRIDSYNNLVSGVGTYTVVYDYDFYGPGTTPAIQITQDAMSNGDYFVITNKTLSSFDITFYDISNTVVSRQFDVMVRGYGRKHDSVII